jgi:hypothetical protein
MQYGRSSLWYDYATIYIMYIYSMYVLWLCGRIATQAPLISVRARCGNFAQSYLALYKFDC